MGVEVRHPTSRRENIVDEGAIGGFWPGQHRGEIRNPPVVLSIRLEQAVQVDAMAPISQVPICMLSAVPGA
jgi:hypothetical protein